jgi:F-type H+-transporting ATPase subunit b
MTVFLFTVFFLLAGGSDSLNFPSSGFQYYYAPFEPYLNQPGFELWKFVNLGIYVAVLVYFLRKPLSETFKQKREEIRAELIKAEEARKNALAELADIEAKLAGLEREKSQMIEDAKNEANNEKERISAETANEVGRLHLQAENEISRRAQTAESELRRLAATESVRLAEQKIKSQMTPEKDAALVGAGISSLGGAR